MRLPLIYAARRTFILSVIMSGIVISGSTVIVSNAEWNGAIEAGSECGGIGFIVKG